MSHTTCWIRQNLRMSDRVSPPKTPYDTIRQCCRKNRTCSIFIRLHPTLSFGPTNQISSNWTRSYVYVLVCMSTCWHKCVYMPDVNMASHEWRTEEWEQFVRLNWSHHCLYNTASKDYKDKNKGVFRLDTTVSIWRRKTQRAGFGIPVNQSENSYRARRVIIYVH